MKRMAAKNCISGVVAEDQKIELVTECWQEWQREVCSPAGATGLKLEGEIVTLTSVEWDYLHRHC